MVQSRVETVDTTVGPGSGQVEELGPPSVPPTWSGRSSLQACAWSMVPRSRRGFARPPFLPHPSPCLCLLCTPSAWATVSLHCLPFCLYLFSFPTPAHVGSWPPGCELLGGRPSINVKCCCPPLPSGPCLHPPGSPSALASPPSAEAPVRASGLPPLSPASTRTVGAVTRVVFIRRRLSGRGLRERMGCPGPAAGFGDLLELGARSSRPR